MSMASDRRQRHLGIPGRHKTLFLGLGHWRLVALIVLWAGFGFADEVPAVVNAEAQRRVSQLLQGVEDYWRGISAKSAAGTNAVRNGTDVETAFRQASQLMPERLDLRFGLASVLVSQALQTNGPQLELKIRQALQVYQEIQSLDPTGFEASILYAAYARAIGESNACETTIRGLLTSHPRRTTDYLQRFDRLDRILQRWEQPPRKLPKDSQQAIVVLGAGLETNGTMKVKLVARLQGALKLARMNPSAPLLLTGGNSKGGITEAYAMGLWLKKRGIPSRRLILEDKARDTVENALYSSAILQRLGVTHVTLVTSPSHLRRGLADFEEACLQRGLSLQWDGLAAGAKGDAHLDQEQERVGIYRDLLRLSGLWAFPGIQR